MLSGSYPGWETSKELTFNGNDVATVDGEVTLNANQTFTGFSVNNDAGHGILVASLSSGESVTISNTTASNNDDDGIHADGIGSGATLTLTNVTANANGGGSCTNDLGGANGLFVAAQEGTLSISNSTFDDNCDNGIHVASFGSSSSTSIATTSASHNGVGVSGGGGNGIELDGIDGTFTFTTLTVNDNSGDGLDAEGNAGPKITATGGTYDGNGDEGIEIDGFPSEDFDEATVTLSNLSASGNGDHGIDLDDFDDSTVSLSGVVANGNDPDGDESGDGIHINDFKEGTRLTISAPRPAITAATASMWTTSRTPRRRPSRAARSPGTRTGSTSMTSRTRRRS